MLRRAFALIVLAALVPLMVLRVGHPAAQARITAPARPAASHVTAHAHVWAGAFAPPCASALRLTPESFSLVYTAHLQDLSEVALDNAAEYWARCRRHATGAALARTPALVARIASLRKLLGAVQGTETDLARLRAGGGTLFFHVLYRAAPDREQVLADIATLAMSSLASAPGSGYALSIVPTLQSIDARLQRMQHPTRTDLQFTSRTTWDRAAQAYAHAVHAAESAAGTRNTALRAVVLNFIDQPLFLNQTP
jgi:hypothetical protein